MTISRPLFTRGAACAGNTETIAELLAAFFAYWGTQHDYNNAVLSIRSGGLISKRSKDW